MKWGDRVGLMARVDLIVRRDWDWLRFMACVSMWKSRRFRRVEAGEMNCARAGMVNLVAEAPKRVITGRKSAAILHSLPD
jgi:hypothetical protein